MKKSLLFAVLCWLTISVTYAQQKCATIYDPSTVSP